MKVFICILILTDITDLNEQIVRKLKADFIVYQNVNNSKQ